MTRLLLFTVLLLAGISPAAAEEPRAASGERLMTEKTEAAVRESLAWLAGRQHENGSFGSGNLQGNVAVTSLAGLAFLAGGNTPNRGAYGAHVTRAVDYLMSQTEPSGFIIDRNAVSQGPMYGHGFATMFLAECYGMAPRAELRAKLVAAVKLIVDSQNREGGWRYWPDSTDADVSVTICQIMALRAARNAGLHVPKTTIDRCIEYVKKCQNPDGGFTYMLNDRGESLFPRSAAGVAALFSAGIYRGPEIDRGLDYLMHFLPGGEPAQRQGHYYYGQYYASGVMWQAGGQRWRKWYAAARDDLLARRAPNGPYWTSPYTDDYATAMACIVLQVPNDALPIFQR
ncbi:MAG: terpene cyclase/mutase family protein [Pirellulales bacterium]|nr:terpene cyclase/mutase family protein [Pirellulales bacterium]